MLQRIKSKKGFTLAELLIVVAIIAVLTAIAVPLFVTSLQKANEATFNANKDVVRTAGITTILNTSDEESQALTKPYKLDALKAGDAFKCTGTFENGKLTGIVVNYEEGGATNADKNETKFKDVKNDIKNCSITVYITVADLNDAKVTNPAS